jgi:hypothetical protein
MELLESLFAGLISLIDGIAKALAEGIVDPLLSDATYRQGFLWGMVSAGVLGFLATQFRFLWDEILQFLSPSVTPPAPGHGPSPLQQTGGCAGSTVALVILGLFLAFFLFRLVLQIGGSG